MSTNNVSEYRALEAACVTLRRMNDIADYECIEIMSDSMLVVEQINGRWRVKDEGIRAVYESANAAFRALAWICPTTLRWFPREHNVEADALCNKVQDKYGVVCSKRKIE